MKGKTINYRDTWGRKQDLAAAYMEWAKETEVKSDTKVTKVMEVQIVIMKRKEKGNIYQLGERILFELPVEHSF